MVQISMHLTPPCGIWDNTRQFQENPRSGAHYVEIPAVQSQQQSPSVENANKKKVHMYAYTS